MDQEHPITVKSRKELRKEKLAVYLANKGKRNSKPNIVCLGKPPESTQPSASQLRRGKENKAPVTTFRYEPKKVQHLASLNNQKPSRKTFVIANNKHAQTEQQPEQSTLCKKSFTGTYSVNTLKATTLPKKPTNVKIQLTAKPSSTFSTAKNSHGTFRAPSNPATSHPGKTYPARLSLGLMVKTRTGLIPAVIQPRVPRPLPAVDARMVSSRLTVASSKALVEKIPLHQRPSLPRELKSVPGKQLSSKSGLKSTVTTSTSARLSNNVANLQPKPTSKPKGQPIIQNSAIGGHTSKNAGILSRKPVAAKPKMTNATQMRTSAPVATQRAPRTCPVTVVSQPRLLTKATKPQTGQKRMAAEQEERMKKLQEWREAKGISYKRPPMQMKPLVRRTANAPLPIWTNLKVEDDARAFIRDTERSLDGCIKLLSEGCPAAQVRGVLSRLPPVSQKFAKFWICKARLMEQAGDLDILPMFEEAVRVVLEPVEELRTVVFDILKKKEENEAREGGETEADCTLSKDEEPENCKVKDALVTPPVRAIISGETGPSSNVKYKITATPGAPSSRQQKPICVDGHELRFFTPVRRSVRIESASRRYPSSLREHDQCVASFAELLDTEEEEEAKARGDTMYVYRENEALKDRVVVQLVREQGTQS
ncbi:cytoskeleton-associated protein 2-like [Syngnathoides biaculeatus]|uniref:cytoskeleton-associated protein 2-like n=1 Tax=Syngnathoides biaculeatus TaxID=300417 RepID=UPI002ADDCD0C|nr:cytoskeleton-associated protein 2-like [Syngnathoides biaculeatus]XP_061671897.1 cytoskeleton-associated protein 2-like [Syngnathoides biaculeatus]